MKKSGFTIVELAIVLVVIGIIIGMAVKGKSLVDAARVRADLAKINKVEAAAAIYYTKTNNQPVWSPYDPERNDAVELGLLTYNDFLLEALGMEHPDGGFLKRMYVHACEAAPYPDDPSSFGWKGTYLVGGGTSVPHTYNSCILVGLENPPLPVPVSTSAGSSHFYVCHVETGLDDMNDRSGAMRQGTNITAGSLQIRIDPAHYADCDALRNTRDREIVYYKIF